MNRKQRRITQSKDKSAPAISLGGKAYTIEDAKLLAIQEYSRGNVQSAADIYQRIIAKAPSHADIHNNLGIILHLLRRYDEALASFGRAIALQPDNAESYGNRALILQEMKRYDEALSSYNKAITLKPDNAGFYFNQGNCLQTLQWYDEALASYDKGIKLSPNHAEIHGNKGDVLREMKLYDEALASYDKAIALKPDYVEAYQNKGVTLVSKGDMPEGERMFRKALALNPEVAQPLYSLTNIRKYTSTDHADVTHIQSLLAKSGNTTDREYLYFSLGKIYDDCGLYDEAFGCFRQANEICNATLSYNPGQVTAFTDHMIEVFTKEFLKQDFPFSSDSTQPLFIVGMPRSGTTLMASILSSHPSIGTAGELATMIDLTLYLPQLTERHAPYPQAVKHLTLALASRMEEEYVKRLQRDEASAIPYIIDKHPMNFRHLGFISMLFPKARIIHCTRDPLYTCLSNFFQRFSSSYDYAFDLENIAHFYQEYERLMAHWRKVLPIPMIEASYEDMTINTESMARNILDGLGLEWDARCLSPHTNPHAVETASRWQVRQPIYKQSVQRWRHYEKHLQALSPWKMGSQ